MSTDNLATALQDISKSQSGLLISSHPKIDDKMSSSLVELPKTNAPTGLIISSMVAGLCNNSSVIKDEETGMWKPLGDPTEV
jgi:hypothetical protein